MYTILSKLKWGGVGLESNEKSLLLRIDVLEGGEVTGVEWNDLRLISGLGCADLGCYKQVERERIANTYL